MSNGENFAYEVYLYRYDNRTDYKIIEDKLGQIDNNTRISIRDIQGEILDEKIRILNSIIVNDRCRRYDSERDLLSYIDMIKISNDSYLCILSVCRNVLGDSEIQNIMNIMFPTSRVKYMRVPKKEEECSDYWKTVMSSIPISENRDGKTMFNAEKEEFFEIELGIKKRYVELVKTNPTYVKGMVTKAISMVMCQVIDKQSVIGQDIRDCGKLESAPLYLKNSNNKQDIGIVSDFLTDMDKYDNITYANLKSLCRFNLDLSVMYSQMIICDNRFKELLKSMQVNTLYKLPSISYENCPIRIIAYIKDKLLSFQYLYDASYFDNINLSMEGVHTAIAKYIECYIDGSFVDVRIEKLISKQTDVEKKILEAKLLILKKIDGFKNIPQEILKDMAAKCGVIRRFSEQCIVMEGERPNNIYIIAKGKIGIECRDNDNYIHSLMILKNNNIFGIEALIDEKKSKVDYKVVGDDATMLTINADVFWEYALQYPELVKSMLKVQTDRLERFQKLWSMS